MGRRLAGLLLACACGEQPAPVPAAPPPPMASAQGTLREVAQAVWTWGGSVEGIAVGPDGTWFATVHSSGALNLWERATGKLLRTLDREVKDVYDGYNNVAVDPQGRWVATGKYGRDNHLGIWDAKTGARLHLLEGHERRVVDLVFTRDGLALLTTDREDVRLWDTTTWTQSAVLGDVGGSDLCLGPEGRVLYAKSGGVVLAWDLEQAGPWRRVVDARRRLWRIAVDGTRLYAGTDLGEILVFELKTGRPVATLRGDHRHPERGKYLRDDDVFGVALSPDGSRLYATTGHQLAAWDTKTLAKVDTLTFAPLPKTPTAIRFAECIEAGPGFVLLGVADVTVLADSR